MNFWEKIFCINNIFYFNILFLKKVKGINKNKYSLYRLYLCLKINVMFFVFCW